jgi:hypothetical protein
MNAIGHTQRCGFDELSIGRFRLVVSSQAQSSKSLITSKKKQRDILPQKITAPHAR